MTSVDASLVSVKEEIAALCNLMVFSKDPVPVPKQTLMIANAERRLPWIGQRPSLELVLD